MDIIEKCYVFLSQRTIKKQQSINRLSASAQNLIATRTLSRPCCQGPVGMSDTLVCQIFSLFDYLCFRPVCFEFLRRWQKLNIRK